MYEQTGFEATETKPTLNRTTAGAEVSLVGGKGISAPVPDLTAEVDSADGWEGSAAVSAACR